MNILPMVPMASRFLIGSTAVGISGGAVFAQLKREQLSLHHRVDQVVMNFLSVTVCLSAGLVLSAATGSILPFIAVSLLTASARLLHHRAPNYHRDPNLPNLLVRLCVLSFVVNSVASGVLLYMQPSIYHGVCLALHTSPFWIPNPNKRR